MPRALSADEILNIFTNLDVNGNEVVSRDELEVSLRRAGISNAQIEKLMTELDINEDGMIGLQEYKIAMGLTNEPIAEWKRLFYSLDRDKTGKVDKRELRKMFLECGMNYSLTELEDWIADHDRDGDGMLDYGEFMDFVIEQSK